MKDEAAHALAEGIRQTVTSAYDPPQTVTGMPVLQIQPPGSLPDAVDAPFLPDGVTVWSVLLTMVTGYVIGTLIGKVLKAVHTRLQPPKQEVTYDVPVEKTGCYPLGSLNMAACMAQSENARLWQHLLAAYGGALEDEGHRLRRDERLKVILPDDVQLRVGLKVVGARHRYFTPFLDSEHEEKLQTQASEEGYAHSWAASCQRAAEAAGWFVTLKGDAFQACHDATRPPEEAAFGAHQI